MPVEAVQGLEHFDIRVLSGCQVRAYLLDRVFKLRQRILDRLHGLLIGCQRFGIFLIAHFFEFPKPLELFRALRIKEFQCFPGIANKR